MPVTSLICNAKLADQGEESDDGKKSVNVSGLAWSGSGRRIIRVDLTSDGGKTWTQAEKLLQEEGKQFCHWGWTLWEASVPVQSEGEIEIWSKAVDSDHNVQPESTRNIWNLRGLLNNAYSKIRLTV